MFGKCESGAGSGSEELRTYEWGYADGFSAVGDYGFLWGRMWYQRLAEQYGIKRERLGAGKSDLSLDQYSPMPETT